MAKQLASLPRVLFGTAWKGDKTAEVVSKAISAGFTGIVSGGDSRNYNEKLVGDAIKQSGKRENLYIQTSFIPASSPHEAKLFQESYYDYSAPIKKQVEASIDKSLNLLQVDQIDTVVIGRPYRFAFDNKEAYATLESLVEQKKIKNIGLQRFHDIDMLKEVYDSATIKPLVIFNRFYTEKNFDPEIRSFAKQQGIQYQSFWTLTGNPQITNQIKYLVPEGQTVQQLWFKYVLQLGITPVTAPENDDQIRQVLALADLPELDEDTFDQITAIAKSNLDRDVSFP